MVSASCQEVVELEMWLLVGIVVAGVTQWQPWRAPGPALFCRTLVDFDCKIKKIIVKMVTIDKKHA